MLVTTYDKYVVILLGYVVIIADLLIPDWLKSVSAMSYFGPGEKYK